MKLESSQYNAMEVPIHHPLIPTNEHGKAVDLAETVTEPTIEEAINTYNRACARLLNPPIWKELAGTFSASFKLLGKENSDPHRLLELHDHISINIPAPGPSAGDGYDWVIVEGMEENVEQDAEESFGIRLRSCANPNNEDAGTAHFFKSDATSTFLVKRNNNTVTVSYHGRNEVPNTTAMNTLDKMRNIVVAAAATIGISELQWSALIKGFLKKEIGG